MIAVMLKSIPKIEQMVTTLPQFEGSVQGGFLLGPVKTTAPQKKYECGTAVRDFRVLGGNAYSTGYYTTQNDEPSFHHITQKNPRLTVQIDPGTLSIIEGTQSFASLEDMLAHKGHIDDPVRQKNFGSLLTLDELTSDPTLDRAWEMISSARQAIDAIITSVTTIRRIP